MFRPTRSSSVALKFGGNAVSSTIPTATVCWDTTLLLVIYIVTRRGSLWLKLRSGGSGLPTRNVIIYDEFPVKLVNVKILWRIARQRLRKHVHAWAVTGRATIWWKCCLCVRAWIVAMHRVRGRHNGEYRSHDVFSVMRYPWLGYITSLFVARLDETEKLSRRRSQVDRWRISVWPEDLFSVRVS
jgi:hypothetical protein